MIATLETTHPDPIWQRLSEVIRPREPMLPSEWADRYRRLNPDLTPAKSKLWDSDFLPWIRQILDCPIKEPWLEGAVFKKGVQCAGSEIGITMMLYFADQHPNPMLFICTKDSSAREFALDRIEPAIELSPRLRNVFVRGRSGKETQHYKRFVGGTLGISGSGSPNNLISKPCAYVFLDELDQLDDFPGMGSALEIAEKRVSEFATHGKTWIFGYAHPKTPDRGAALLYRERSDQREWTLDCPHCQEPIFPKWEQVFTFDRDPDTAEWRCPHCAKPINDVQRWEATRNGRFVSQLEPEQRKKKRWAGFHVSKLCHPRITLRELASDYVACTSESQLRVFFNMQMGEAYLPAQFVLTEEAIREKQSNLSARTCPRDTVFITCGVDVQKRSTLYYRVDAWTRNGNCCIIEYGRLQGFPALDALLRTFVATKTNGEEMTIRACGIDSGYMTQDVYSFSRQTHGRTPAMPMKHAPGVRADEPIRYKKTVDPSRPELGPLTRLELCRDHWMDRQLGRFAADSDPGVGGSVVLPANVSNEFINHIKAPMRHEEIDEFGHPRITWVKEKNTRDDYLQAGVYSEVVAVLLGLDKIHELAPGSPGSIADREQSIAEGHVERQSRSEGRSGRYTRGRRYNSSKGRRMW